MDIHSINPAAGLRDASANIKKQNEHEKNAGSAEEAAYYSKNSMSVNGYNRSGEAVEGSSETGRKPNVAELKAAIKQEISRQTAFLLEQAAFKQGRGSELDQLLKKLGERTGDIEDPLGLGKYFKDNPEDWETVQNGGIPDYFNVQNTAQRILDIWLPGYDGTEDVDEWAARTKNFIGQAYGEVSQLVGNLPDIVRDTREYIMNALDQFAAERRSIHPAAE